MKNKPASFVIRFILIFFLMFLSARQASATHLFGGYITYKYLGNDQYEVTLRVYRDCSDPNNLAFENEATIHIRDQSYTFITSVDVPKGPTIPVINTGNSCMVIPSTVCVEYADYIDTLNLPPLAAGYSLYYQSCCRNALISNIPDPLNTTYSYVNTIPPNDTVGNSSPQVEGPPPVFICLNEPIDFSLQTSEPDGDSIHYELCDILAHPRFTNQKPSPVTFLPPYSSQYPMDAVPPFTVDPQTGDVSGTPIQMGHYVLGVCITEYRNGVPLSTVRFDYQFSVINCMLVESDMLTQVEDSTITCGSYTVDFTDQSKNASGVFWDFGDTTTLADTSRMENPTYSYPGPGSYTVKLIANSGTGCADTTEEVFEVVEPIVPEFSHDGAYCFFDQPISIVPVGNYPASASYQWNFGAGAAISSSTQKEPPPISWNSAGKHYVELVVTDGGCSYREGDSIEIVPTLNAQMVLPEDNPGMTCNGLDVHFQNKSPNVERVFWDFGVKGTKADTSNEASVNYTFPEPGTYKIKLYATREGFCSDTSVFRLDVHHPLEPRVEIQGEQCYEVQDLIFNAVGDYPAGTRYTWNFSSLGEDSVRGGNSASNVSWDSPGEYLVQLIVEKGYCMEEVYDTVEIRQLSVTVGAGDTQRVEEGARIYLSAMADAEDYYWWADQPAYISSPFSESTSVDLDVQGVDSVVKFYVRVTDAAGCEGLDSTHVIINIDETERLYNFISPNGDGKNDYFDISSLMTGDDCNLTIMNRWGSEVYHARDYQNDWNGVDDEGDLLPDGTYYYIIYCTPTVRATGPITIIRSRFR